MLNLKEPVGMSLLTLGTVFVVSLGVLYLVRPSWILKIDKKSGANTIAWPIVVAYALTFAFVCGTAALLITSSRRGSPEPVATQSFPPSSAFPSLLSAKAYTS